MKNNFLCFCLEPNHNVLLNWQMTFKAFQEVSANALAHQTCATVSTKFFANEDFGRNVTSNYTQVLPFQIFVRNLFEYSKDQRTREYATIGLMFAQKRNTEALEQLKQLQAKESRNQLLTYLALYTIPTTAITSAMCTLSSLVTSNPVAAVMSQGTILLSAMAYASVAYFKEEARKTGATRSEVANNTSQLAIQWACAASQFMVARAAGGKYMLVPALCMALIAETYSIFGTTRLHSKQVAGSLISLL